MQLRRNALRDFICENYPGYYLRSEVAAALRVSQSSLRRAADSDWERLGPSLYATFEGVAVYLYAEEDVDLLIDYFEARWPRRPDGTPRRRAGCPRLWTEWERRDRVARLRSVSYLRAKAEAQRAEGLLEPARATARKAEEKAKQLAAERAERFRLATRPGWRLPDDPVPLPPTRRQVAVEQVRQQELARLDKIYKDNVEAYSNGDPRAMDRALRAIAGRVRLIR